MKYLALTFMLAMTFASCTKETLDLSNSQFYNIAQILESSNCDANCEEMADCEGQRVKVVGLIDPANINGVTRTFGVIDRRDEKTDMVVVVDSLISSDVFVKLAGNGDKTVRVTGILEGIDGSSSTNCQRVINMRVTEASDVNVEL